MVYPRLISDGFLNIHGNTQHHFIPKPSDQLGLGALKNTTQKYAHRTELLHSPGGTKKRECCLMEITLYFNLDPNPLFENNFIQI